MAITYNAGTDTITVTGYTEATPCNFTDVYNADVAGSWGKVTKQGTCQYRLDMETLQIGDGSTSTWFKDTNKEILFSYYTNGVYWTTLEIKANANFQLGVLNTTGSEDFGDDGCAIWYRDGLNAAYTAGKWDNYGNLKLYECAFNNFEPNTKGHVIDTHSTGTIKSYDCISKFPYAIQLSNVVSSDIKRLTVIKAAIALRVNTGTDTFEGVNIFKSLSSNVFVEGGGIATFKNCYMPDNSSGFPTKTIRIHTGGGTINIINSTRADYPIYWTVDGYVYYKYEFDLKLIDKNGAAIDSAKVKLWDKLDAIVTNVSTNSSGVITTQTLTTIRKTKNTTTTSITTDYTPHEMRIYKYGKSMQSSKSNIEKKTDWALTMYADDNITQTTEATVAAYTGITVDHTLNTITISENHTLAEIYDYCQYDIIAAAYQLDQSMHTSDGVNFVSEYSFIVNTGITVTATNQKLTMESGYSYTLTGTAQFTGIIATTTTTRIPIKLMNIIDGSRYWVGKESDGSTIFEGTQSGSGTVTGYYEHTANINIDIRVRKSSAAVKYKPWVGEGTLSAEAFSLRIRQILDSIIS